LRKEAHDGSFFIVVWSNSFVSDGDCYGVFLYKIPAFTVWSSYPTSSRHGDIHRSKRPIQT
jgi:hypothetical protein